MPFMRSESCSFIWHPKVVTWKGLLLTAVTEGTGGRALLRVVHRARLADHRHLDLPGVLELLLDVARDLARQRAGAVVADRARLDDHADLAAGLHGVHLVDAVVAGGELLQVAQALDVLLQRLAAR